MRKIILPFLIVFLLVCSVFAQTAQTITLKPGFNFVSFTSAISLTPTQLKTQNPVIEDIYLFSAAAGSFLSANDGTLSTLAAGKGYIVKSSATSDTPLSVSGDAVQTIGNINIKTGFNLIGFSKIPSTTSTFKSLMNVYSSIKGMYKWSPVAGSFIQVIRSADGTVTLLDGVDPTIKAGESYFFNMAEDTTLNYDGTDIILGSGPPAPVAKTLEITGTVGASTTASPSYSVARAIDLSTMQLSVYDEINNASVEGAVVTATGADTFKATLPVATADRYLSVLVKNSDNKVVYKTFLGRVPKATEVTENTVKISNIKVSDESTARAIIVLENRAKIPVTAVIAKTSVDASIAKTDFALALEEHIAGLEDRVPELKLAINLIANVLTTAGVDAAIKQKVTETAFAGSTDLLKNYVSLMQDANTLQTVNNITAPAELTIGNYKVTAQSSLAEIDDAVIGMNDTIKERTNKPTFEPIGGTYNKSLDVVLKCATEGATIRYTIDGSAPQNSSIVYNGPIKLEPRYDQYIIRAVADKNGLAQSFEVWHSYQVLSRIATKLVLSKETDSVNFGGIYDLSQVKAIVEYNSGETETVNVSWEYASQNSYTDEYSENLGYSESNIYYTYHSSAYSKPGKAFLKARYNTAAGEVISYFVLNVIKDDVYNNIESNTTISIINLQRKDIGIAGGTLFAGTSNNLVNAILEVPTESAKSTREIVFAEIYDKTMPANQSDAINYNETHNYYLKTDSAENLILKFPLPDWVNENNMNQCFSVTAIDPLTKEKIAALPFSLFKKNNVSKSKINKMTWPEFLLIGAVTVLVLRSGVEIYTSLTYPIQFKANEIILPVSYYEQFHELCLPTCCAMVKSPQYTIYDLTSKIYKTEDNFIFNKTKTINTDYSENKMLTYGISNTKRLTDKKIISLFNYLIDSINNNAPLVMLFNDPDFKHAIVVYGYSGCTQNTAGKNNYDNVIFKIHNPSTFPVKNEILPGPCKSLSIQDLEKLVVHNYITGGINNIRLLDSGNINIDAPLQTIHMPDYAEQSASEDSGIIFKNLSDNVIDYIWWDPNVDTKGFRFFNSYNIADKTDLPLQDFDLIECKKIPVYNVDPKDFPFLKLKISVYDTGWLTSALIYEDSIDLLTANNGYKYSFDDIKIPWYEFKQNPLPLNSKFKNSKSERNNEFKLVISIAKLSNLAVDIGSFSIPFQTK